MARNTVESKGGRELEAGSGEPDFKWAVEWLVRKKGQRGAAEILGVNRKTVALAMRRERLTGRMNHAVQTLLANLDDPARQDVMPLDRIESQIKRLLESMEELDGQIETLVLRVEAVERAQSLAQAGAEAHRGEGSDDGLDKGLVRGPEPDRTEGRFGRGR